MDFRQLAGEVVFGWRGREKLFIKCTCCLEDQLFEFASVDETLLQSYLLHLMSHFDHRLEKGQAMGYRHIYNHNYIILFGNGVIIIFSKVVIDLVWILNTYRCESCLLF